MNSMSSGMSNMGGMGGGLPGPLGNIANLATMLNQFVQNPAGAIMGMGYNVPQNVQSGGPEAIVNYLRSSGQMSEQQFNQFFQLANSPIAQQLQNSLRR
jgi:hypothetical protein